MTKEIYIDVKNIEKELKKIIKKQVKNQLSAVKK